MAMRSEEASTNMKKLKYTSSKYKGIINENKTNSTNKNKGGSENITREYEDMIKKD